MLIKFATKDFIADKKYKNLSIKTIGGYVSILDMFQDYCSKIEIVSVHDISAQTVKSFLMKLQGDKGNNPTTRNNKLRVLKNFFNWLFENEMITEKQNICKKVQYAKEEIIIQPFSDYHIEQMLGYLRRIKQREQKRRNCKLDTDFQRSIVFKRKIEVWIGEEMDCVGLIEGYSDASVKLEGGYYLRENCEFVMV